MNSECELCKDAAFVNVFATRYSESDEPYLDADTFAEIAHFCPRCGRELPFTEVKVA